MNWCADHVSYLFYIFMICLIWEIRISTDISNAPWCWLVTKNWISLSFAQSSEVNMFDSYCSLICGWLISGKLSNNQKGLLLWIWLKDQVEKVLGLRTPVHDIRGVPVQGPLPDSQQSCPVRLTHKRASTHQTVEVKMKSGVNCYRKTTVQIQTLWINCMILRIWSKVLWYIP